MSVPDAARSHLLRRLGPAGQHRAGGGLFTGAELNESEDAVAFGRYSDRWIVPYLANGAAAGPEMLGALHDLLEEHLAPLDGPRPWAWKEPRSVYYLPYLGEHLPGLHFVPSYGTGAWPALSGNQNQLLHGDDALPLDPTEPEPLRSIRLRAWINGRTADWGERELGDRYLRLRFEDFCERPAETAAALPASSRSHAAHNASGRNGSYFSSQKCPATTRGHDRRPITAALARWCHAPKSTLIGDSG